MLETDRDQEYIPQPTSCVREQEEGKKKGQGRLSLPPILGIPAPPRTTP